VYKYPSQRSRMNAIENLIRVQQRVKHVEGLLRSREKPDDVYTRRIDWQKAAQQGKAPFDANPGN